MKMVVLVVVFEFGFKSSHEKMLSQVFVPYEKVVRTKLLFWPTKQPPLAAPA